MVRVPSSQFFWPSNRRLFRQRARLRVFVPIAVVAMAAGLALAVVNASWV
jgi:hypothetical protein